ncbi:MULTISPECIES: hypothetical protein [unclassified Pseudomonas]|uniref:hypothetical protein n=1 Tax=unclassified Pseudomonas TaxID=196821 RepID=UPI0004893471|nr:MULTISPECIES: hypothetical protein [unclassified Pseudomonas]SMF19942.1 hypothetical protein SAMN05660912_02048 [Pseudomonas sp. LAMO17WK12:I1]
MDFKITYWTRRWSANTTLTVQKTEAGWHISHVAINGDADREGVPFLESNLHQDNVQFPHDVGAFLGFVWDQLNSGKIDEQRAQEMIQEIGDWITACETSQPVWKVWNS